MSKVNRRSFLRKSALYTASACCAAGWGGPFAGRKAYAQSLGGSNRTMVFINLLGGNDHLNSFAVPFTSAVYHDSRPTIGIAQESALKLSDSLGMNPILGNIHRLFEEGNVAVIQGVGDPTGSRSHFSTQEYISRGISAKGKRDQRGWIGRLGDLYLQDVPFNTFSIGLGTRTDFTSQRDNNRPLVVRSLSSVDFRSHSGVSTQENLYRQAILKGLIEQESALNLSTRTRDTRRATKAFFDSIATIQTST